MLLSKEEIYFQKICLLLTLSVKAVRKVFDEEISPIRLKGTLLRNFNRLKKLNDRGIITNIQWDILFSNKKGSPSSSLFDTTLMIILLQQLTSIQVSDMLPFEKDDSVGAHLGRIRYYRNLTVHSTTNKLTSRTYATAWSCLSQAIQKLMKPGSLEEEMRHVREMDIVQLNNDVKFEISNSLKEVNRLKSSYVVLQDSLKHMEDILSDKVPVNIKSQHNTELISWQKDDQMYVKTSCSKQIQLLVLQNKLTAIIGGPGSGKTSVMRHIALKIKNIGFFVIPITIPNDIIKFYDAKKPTLFVIDNFCGKYTLDPHIYDSWVQVVKHIADIPLMDNFKIILACRLQVFLDIRFNFKSMFEDCTVNLHENTLTWAEKIGIAKKYGLKIDNNDDKIKTNLQLCYCFPLLCSFHKRRQESVPGDIFMYPYDVLEIELEMMYSNRESGAFCAIVFLVVFDNHLSQKFFENRAAYIEDYHFEEIVTACSLKKDHEFKNVFHSLMQSFVSETDGVYHALDSKMFDFLAHFVGGKNALFLIENALPSVRSNRFMFINPRADEKSFTVPIDSELCYVGTAPLWDELGKYVILIPTENEQNYYIRMLDDWYKGFANYVVSSYNFYYRPFFTFLNQLNNNVLHMLVNKEDVFDRSTPIITYVRTLDNGFPHISWFVSKGADINHCNKYNKTALHYACSMGKLDAVDRLLEKKADPNICDNDGCSPLHFACANGFENIFIRLLKSKANINIRNKEGNSPLIMACNNKHIIIVKILLEQTQLL